MSLADVRARLWNGCVNVRVTAALADGSVEYLFAAPRNSYLPVYFDGLVRYFSRFTELKAPLWLEYEGVPVKWHLPVGLLYDVYHLPGRGADAVFELAVGTGDFPDLLMPYENDDYVRSANDAVFNQLKQSTFVLNGNAKPMFNLSKDDSFELWRAIEAHDVDAFRRINAKIVPRRLHRLPVRVYVPGTATVVQPVVSASEPLSLGQFAAQHLPRVPVGSLYVEGVSCERLESVGMRELWDTFKNVDNFLYLVVILR